MIMTSYIGTIPRELEEAAEVDGASPVQYVRYILLPLTKVPIASLTVIMLPYIWNDFLQPYVYLDLNNSTLLPFVQNFSGLYTVHFQPLYAAVFISIIPLAVIYFAFRSWFIRGALSGAVKA
jgi:raffinose/stachyose/melibiose transport system permease protein